jgi:hypothetical protein
MPSTKLTIRVDIDWLWRLKAVCVGRRMTVTAYILAAVAEKLERDKE